MNDSDSRRAAALAAIQKNDLAALERVLAAMPRAELAREWEPAPLLHDVIERRRFGGRCDRALLEALLRSGADPNVERAEWDGDRSNRTALWFAVFCGDRDAFRVLLEAGADPDVLTTSDMEPEHDVYTIRDRLPDPLAELVQARIPRPAREGLAGAWELAAEQRAPGGKEDEEALESDDECRPGFAGTPGRLVLGDDHAAHLVLGDDEHRGTWTATDDGFSWTAVEGDENFGARFHSAVLQGNLILKLWIEDRRYHFRREGTFHRQPVRRSATASPR